VVKSEQLSIPARKLNSQSDIKNDFQLESQAFNLSLGDDLF
jgi:hypothetical protein